MESGGSGREGGCRMAAVRMGWCVTGDVMAQISVAATAGRRHVSIAQGRGRDEGEGRHGSVIILCLWWTFRVCLPVRHVLLALENVAAPCEREGPESYRQGRAWWLGHGFAGWSMRAGRLCCKLEQTRV